MTTMADNTIFLLRAAAARRANALDAARAAIGRLDQQGRQITFRAVAAEAGVSRSWLYSDPDVRAEIERLRALGSPRSAPVPASQRATGESLRQRLDALHDEITRLRQDNQCLRDQLARELGRRRTSAT